MSSRAPEQRQTATCICFFVALATLSACARSPGSASAGNGPVLLPADSGRVERVDVRGERRSARTRDSASATAYGGVDRNGIPHYFTSLSLSAEDALVLRRAYGIEDPHRLYLSDSSGEGILKYDTQVKRCQGCYVNSFRIGFVSVRAPDESWEEAERRVRSTPPGVFTGGPTPESDATSDLDPDVRPVAERMLRDASAAGFRVKVTATYRSPLREAFLMAEERGRTHTLTSNHSYGRALDIVIDDGNVNEASTRRDWIAFRKWVTAYPTALRESFRILGRADQSWDWRHVELPSESIGFTTIDDAVRRGRACLQPRAHVTCNFAPHLPARLTHPLVQ